MAWLVVGAWSLVIGDRRVKRGPAIEGPTGRTARAETTVFEKGSKKSQKITAARRKEKSPLRGRHQGMMKARRHEGTKARRHAGTQARRHEGTQARRHGGPRRERDGACSNHSPLAPGSARGPSSSGHRSHLRYLRQRRPPTRGCRANDLGLTKLLDGRPLGSGSGGW